MITKYSRPNECISFEGYIIKLGQSYMADYVGFFESKAEADQWLEDNDYEPRNCSIIRVKDKTEYAED